MAKDFLNSDILGINIPTANDRGFRSVNTDNLPIPEYDGRYFETFPTVWANAYAFRKQLEKGDAKAIEEWATLFLLHYFGILHLENFHRRLLETEFDKDLWLALSGTYPRSRDESELQAIGILRTSDRTTIGAYYPQIVFFPSRGRESWYESESLRPYLDENNFLSWEKSSALLLESNYYRDRFQSHLRGVPNILPRRELKMRLENFCAQNFGAFYGQPKVLHQHPSQWETETSEPPSPEELLEAYPLKKTNSDGGKTYYLLAGLDLTYQPPWVKRIISPRLPAPADYLVGTNDGEIIVRLAVGNQICRLNRDQGDRIVLLEDLFLPHEPAYCKLQRESESFISKISLKHEIALQEKSIQPNEKAVCLAPFAHKFFQHFPEILSDAKKISAEPTADGNVNWSVTILGEDIVWRSGKKPMQRNLAITNLSLYPPKVSPQWKLYLAHGTGSKEKGGRWHLIDENGWLGVETELEEEEYISVLHREGKTPNRPRALMLKDDADNERGILLLSELDNIDLDADQTATLAVDFGTSNTCLAVKTKSRSEVLNFSVSPETLWGQKTPAENPGFVPKRWGGHRGFFPTILFSRKSDARLPHVEPESIRLEHLLKTDIPGLHKGINDSFAAGVFTKQWRPHGNLKWNTDTRTPWRSLFLELILLYAHGEVFFSGKRKAGIEKYVFTYPLAFSSEYGNTYHNKAQEAIRKIRYYCYGEALDADINNLYDKIDESSAIALSSKSESARGRLEVFADIGGGTADIAIRHQNEFLVLDSVKVAGQTFFQFAKKNFEQNSKLAGAADFRKNLNRIIRGKAEDLDLNSIESELADDLGSFYAVEINELDESVFEEREENVIKQRMGAVSYQRYRSRLFFYHILAYALLQACATVVDRKITLSNGINLILGGNGWGLLLFAEFPRKSSVLLREAKDILVLLKESLAEVVTEEEKPLLDKIYIESVDLLNADSLSKAKTSVAIGALYDGSKNAAVSDTAPYAGITIRDLEINDSEPKTVRWCDRWSYDSFRDLFGRFTDIKNRSFAQPDELKNPIDKTLSVFTGVGNTSKFGKDNAPDGMWMRLNSQIVKSVSEKLQTEGERLNLVPINYFLSEILYPKDTISDLLDKLADSNLNGNNDKED